MTTVAPPSAVDQLDAYIDTQIAELLANAETCDHCDLPLLSSALNAPSRTAWVDTDLRAIAPHDRETVAAFLDRGPTRPLGTRLHGRFRTDCRSPAEAVSIAAHLHHLGAPVNAITIGTAQ